MYDWFPEEKNFLFRTSLAPILEQEVLSRFRSKMATGTFQAWINKDRIFLKLLRHTTLPLEAKKKIGFVNSLVESHGKSSSQIWITPGRKSWQIIPNLVPFSK